MPIPGPSGKRKFSGKFANFKPLAEPRTAPAARPRAPWPGRFAVIFGACFLAGFGVLTLPPVQTIDGRFSHVLVALSHELIHICGGTATVEGTILRAPGGFAVEMRDGCNAVNVTIFLWAGVIAFPAAWKMRALGAIGGGLIIQAVNVIRFITLFYIGQCSATWFGFAHGYLWESLIVLDTVVIFWLWVSWVSRTGKFPNAGI